MSESSRTWNLSPQSEYRFELEANTSLAIRLTSGNAEVFGAELAPGRVYLFGGECKAVVFTWYGCVLEISHFLTFIDACALNTLFYTSLAALRPSIHPTKLQWFH
ncbi:Cleavage polyadenylation factor subunit clp1 [Ceratobasidium sp. 394]|nr:Cleavage polyadenylation factor subunit clp1 [Ceratobasidium sp. 394]